MKATFTRAAAVAAVTGLGATAALAAPATYTATANAEIIAALSIVENAQLDFGSIVPDAGSASVVQLAATATPTPTNTGAGNASFAGGHSSGDFTISGLANANIVVSLPPSATVTCGACGGATMNVANFTTNGTLAAGSWTFTLDGTGAATVYVGGDLTVAATQAVGTYVGNYVVTADYN